MAARDGPHVARYITCRGHTSQRTLPHLVRAKELTHDRGRSRPAEQDAAPDGGRITVFRSSASHQRPPRVSVGVRGQKGWAMGKRTWTCVTCRKSYQRKPSLKLVDCPTCQRPCE